MQRVYSLIDKLKDLSKPGNKLTAIEVDLMLDYTRVIYADLLEIRGKVDAPTPVSNKPPTTQQQAPPTPTTPHSPPQPPRSVPQEKIEPQQQTEEEKEEPSASDNLFSIPRIPDVEQSDIRSSIGINDKYLYISELFQNDKAAYDQVIKKLNSFSSYQDATTWLSKDVAPAHGWNDDMEAVQSFYELLNSFFLSK